MATESSLKSNGNGVSATIHVIRKHCSTLEELLLEEVIDEEKVYLLLFMSIIDSLSRFIGRDI